MHVLIRNCDTKSVNICTWCDSYHCSAEW